MVRFQLLWAGGKAIAQDNLGENCICYLAQDFFQHLNHWSMLLLRLQGQFRNSALSLFVQTNCTVHTQIIQLLNSGVAHKQPWNIRLLFSVHKSHFLFPLSRALKLLGKHYLIILLQDVSATTHFPLFHIQRMLSWNLSTDKGTQSLFKPKILWASSCDFS